MDINLSIALESATISALGGNDSIYNSGSNVSINDGDSDGKDFIFGFDNTDTLRLDGLDLMHSR